MLPEPVQIGFVLTVVGIMMVALVREVARPDMILFTVLAVFLLSGVINAEQALQGFSNQGMLTIALLFIIAGAIQKSGIFDKTIAFVLGSRSEPRKAIFKMMLPISGLSAFLNNTPIVVTFTPFVRKWCQDHNISPSKFLIPLSYATIMGGMITLMGTSTNLVVHGWLVSNGKEGFSIFQLAVVGLPVAVIGLIYLGTIGYKLLPSHRALTATVEEHSREYLAEMVVEPKYPHIGKTIEQAGLRNLKGLFLIEIIRGEERISPVKSTTVMESGDRLIFTGDVSTIADLQNTKGLRLAPGEELSLDLLKNGNTELVEVVVSHQSTLLSKRVKDTGFRGKYDAAVVAVHRNNERVKGKIGDIVLKPGDTLLLLAGSDFQQRKNLFNDFYVVTPIGNPFLTKEDAKKGWIAITTLVAMILLVTFNVLSMFKAMTIVVIVLLLARVVTPEEARKSVQFNVLLLIASAFGIGEALTESGAAGWIASGLVQVAQPFGIIAILLFIYLLTNIFTEMITNNAAAIMMIPIAMKTAEQIGANPTAFAVIVAIAASASFITPIGYQTNMIVMGPGGYKFTDFAKVGFPLSLIVMVVTVAIVNFVWI
ncbi:MAG TPA: SLC13 family permease [Bacillales bacterium]|nr:SLC13 family permease [Bacillales bacterium]